MKKSDFSWFQRHRTLILFLCISVVFITTYLLVLPAFTLETETAEEQGGISVTTEASDNQSDPSDISMSDQTTEEVQKTEEDTQAVEKQADAVPAVEKEAEPAKPEQKDSAFKAGKLAYDGKGFDIEVAFDEQAGIPAGAQLKAKEIAKDSKDYKKYLEDSVKELGTDQERISFARFFDIEIRKDAKKIEPKSAVKVKITYKDAVEMNEADKLSVVHFAEEGNRIEPEVIEDVKLNKKTTEISYEQESFSVTGTIVETPQENGQYAVIIRHNGKYYGVQSDGSLLEVTYHADTNTVDMDYPMFWTYSSENVDSSVTGGYSGAVTNLRIPTEASGYDSQQLPSGYYYRYIDPNTPAGIREEEKQETQQQAIVSHPRYVWECAIRYENHHIQGFTDYIGVNEDATHIIGGVSDQNAAEVYLAEVTSIPPSANLNHTVNHIDISIEGGASLSIPLAYGTYTYYVDGEERTLTVTEGNDVTLDLKHDTVPITPEDMKHAEITAYSPASGILNNVYYITGYSQNATSDYSTPQVRMEGSFKVSDLDPYTDTTEDALTEEQLNARKENRIYYTVTAKKELTFNWEYEYADGQKAQLYDAEGNPLSSTVMVNLSKSFDYWDPTNECPPLHLGGPAGEADWQAGHILWDTSEHNGSGMDFKLEAHADASVGVVAIEITKTLLTNTGEVLHPKSTVTNQFIVYQKTPATTEDIASVVDLGVESPIVGADDTRYTGIHAKTVSVGESGEGMVYDYDVKEGMAYIKEDQNSIKQEIVDTDGRLWTYDSTRTETAYAWRQDGDSGKRHKSSNLISVPDVVGNYGTWIDDNGDEQPLFNGFLEFYVYNVYEPKTYPVSIKKIDAANLEIQKPEGLNGAKFDLYGPYETAQSTDEDKQQTMLMSVETLDDGMVSLGNLSDGVYYLYETQAPDGYNLPEKPIRIVVDSSKEGTSDSVVTYYVDDGEEGSAAEYIEAEEQDPYYQLLVPNESGVVLPHTGGSGTWIYTMIGMILIAAGGIWLTLRRRRMA